MELTREALENIFKEFNDLNVLIIGDVMVDKYLWGDVNRISPEAPVPIVSVKRKEARLGGAANVAINVKALGANPILCSVIGVDPNGDVFLKLLKEQKLNTKGILKSRDRITTEKTRIMGNKSQVLRVDEEMVSEIKADEMDQLVARISNLLKSEKIDVIIFQDYDKGLITLELIQQILRLASEKNIPTVVDPKKRNFNNYSGVSLFKPNFKELQEGLNKELSADKMEELKSEIEKFRLAKNIGQVLLTLSEKGIYVHDKEQQIHVPAYVRNISDVSGAGDTVISVAALGLALELPSKISATLANLAGGIVCEEVGAVPINKERLFEEALELTKN